MSDPVVSPADTIRRIEQALELARLRLATFAPHGFDSSRSSDYGFAQEMRSSLDDLESLIAALLAVGERDKAEIEALTAEITRLTMGWAADRQHIAQLTEALNEVKLTTKAGSHVHAVACDALAGTKHEPFRAVLADEEDARG